MGKATCLRTIEPSTTMAPTHEQAAPAEQPSAQNEEKVVIMSTQGPVVKDAKAETEYAKNARGGGYNGGLVNFQSEGDTDFAANAFWRNTHTAFPVELSDED